MSHQSTSWTNIISGSPAPGSVIPVGTFEDIITKGPWADVRAFGATGDGVTDDTAAINLAITAAGVGGRVYFPKGTYIITSALLPLTAQTWFGDSISSVIKQTTSNEHIINATSSTSNDISAISISNLKLQGTGKGVGTGCGILLRSESQTLNEVQVFNLQITAIGQDGVRVEGTGRTKLFNLDVGACGRDGFRFGSGGAGFGTADNCLAVGCYSSGNDANGWTIGPASGESVNGSFIQCQAESSGAKGWEIGGSAGILNLERCKSEGGVTGFLISSVSFNIVLHCCAAAAHSGQGFDIDSQCTLINPNASDTNSGNDIDIASGVNQVTIIDPEGTVVDNNGENLIIGNNLVSNMIKMTKEFGVCELKHALLAEGAGGNICHVVVHSGDGDQLKPTHLQ